MKRVILGYLLSALLGTYVTGLAVCIAMIMQLPEYNGDVAEVFFWPF